MRKQKGFSTDRAVDRCGDHSDYRRHRHSELTPFSVLRQTKASAVGSMRTINTAEITFASTYPSTGYSADLASLAGTACTSPTSAGACLIDSTLGAAVSATAGKSGYYFTYTADANVGYTLLGTPAHIGSTGIKQFYTDGTAVIRYNTGAAASATSPAIQ